MTRPWVNRRAAPSFGRYLSALAPTFLHAGTDRSKVVGGARPGDDSGVAVWRQISDAIGQLANTTPPGAVH
jgi:hypothetical protein